MKKFCILIFLITACSTVYNKTSTTSIIRGPYLQNVSSSQITILWDTSNTSKTQVQVRNENNSWNHTYTADTTNTTSDNHHEIVIDNLSAGKKYFYKIVDEDIPEYSFQTSKINDSYKFAVWGDSQDSAIEFSKTINNMIKFDPNFAIGVGDYVNNGFKLPSWDKLFFTPGKKFLAQTPIFLTIGNHDYGVDENKNWDFTENSGGLKLFKSFFKGTAGTRTYYSFNYGNSHFIILDTNVNQSMDAFDIPPESEQYRWLVQDLKSNASTQAAFRFVFFHEPPYSTTWDEKYYDGEKKIRDHIVPILEKNKVDIVFSGHAHLYERGDKNGTTYVVTGGGAGNLDNIHHKMWPHLAKSVSKHHFVGVKVENDKLSLDAIATDGEIIDSFQKNSARNSR